MLFPLREAWDYKLTGKLHPSMRPTLYNPKSNNLTKETWRLVSTEGLIQLLALILPVPGTQVAHRYNPRQDHLTTHPTGAASQAPGHRMLEANQFSLQQEG